MDKLQRDEELDADIIIVPVMPNYQVIAEAHLAAPGIKRITDPQELEATLRLAKERGLNVRLDRWRGDDQWPLTGDEALEAVESYRMEMRGDDHDYSKLTENPNDQME